MLQGGGGNRHHAGAAPVYGAYMFTALASPTHKPVVVRHTLQGGGGGRQHAGAALLRFCMRCTLLT